jgi:hypothetical protein
MKSHSLKSKPSSYKTAALMASWVLGALFISGAALAITDTAFNYSAAKTGYYGISNLGLAPNEDGGDYFNTADGDTGLGTSGNLQCFGKGINLPNGATIKNLVVYFAGVEEGDVAVYLRRQRISDGGHDMIGSRSFTDFSGTRKSQSVPIVPSFAVVNNAQYIYDVEVCVDPGGAFYGARMAYSYTNAGD